MKTGDRMLWRYIFELYNVRDYRELAGRIC